MIVNSDFILSDLRHLCVLFFSSYMLFLYKVITVVVKERILLSCDVKKYLYDIVENWAWFYDLYSSHTTMRHKQLLRALIIYT